MTPPTDSRSPRSMERIERMGRFWAVYAGDLGEGLGCFRTKAEAKDALDTWHYFHPEEQAARNLAWMENLIQLISEANDGRVADVDRALDLIRAEARR